MNPIIPKSANSPTTHAALSRRIFRGEILCFRGLEAIRRLTQTARKIARESFDCAHPRRAHLLYKKAEFFARAERAQKAFNDAECKSLFADALREIGLPAEEMFWDTLGLRVSPPVATHSGGFRSSVKVHRDTWGSAMPAQINWWAPVWDVTAKRTMGFYPSYWNRPLANTTAQWSFAEFLASRKQSAPGEMAKYPSAPRALEEPDEEARPVLIRPGELLAFSSAHLHSSIPNQTALTRFSLEIRTLGADDLQKQRGAKNVDNESRKPLFRLFRGITSNEPPAAHWF